MQIEDYTCVVAMFCALVFRNFKLHSRRPGIMDPLVEIFVVHHA